MPGSSYSKVCGSSLVATALVALFVPISVSATPADALDRVNLSVGAYFSKVDSSASLNAFQNRFQTAPFELTDGSHPVGRVRLVLLVGDRHGFELDFYSFRPGNSRSFDQAYRVAGTDYTLNAEVSGRARFDVGSASYRWWLGEGSTLLGFGVGAAYYGVSRISLNKTSGELAANLTFNLQGPSLFLKARF